MKLNLLNITETNFQGERNSNYKDYDKGICSGVWYMTRVSEDRAEYRIFRVRNKVRGNFMETHKTLNHFQSILRRKNKAGGIVYPDFKQYYKASVIKPVWY